MTKELRNNIITALIGAALASAGFLGKDYIDEKNRQHQYIDEIYKQLYDKEAIELEKVNAAYAELQSALANNYALTTYELDPSYTKFQDSVESYKKYMKELERLGNSEQVQAAKTLDQWLTGMYAEFNLQYKTAEEVQRRTQDLLLTKNTKSDYFKSMSENLDTELERLVQNENRVYYEAGWYQKPVINGLQQYLNYQFRSAIGLGLTSDIAQAIHNLPKISKRKTNLEYKESSIPFVFAEGRAFEAPTLQFKGDIDPLKQKNEVLKAQVRMKFIAQVIEHDKTLQEALKQRKLSSQ